MIVKSKRNKSHNQLKLSQNIKHFLILIIIGVIASLYNVYNIYNELSENNVGNQIEREKNKIVKLEQQIRTLNSKYKTKEIGEILNTFNKLNRTMLFMYGKFMPMTNFTIKSTSISQGKYKPDKTTNPLIKYMDVTIDIKNKSNFISELKSLIYLNNMMKNKPFEITSLNGKDGKMTIKMKIFGKDSRKNTYNKKRK